MKVTVTDKEKSQKEITITVPSDVWAQEMDAVITHFGSQLKVSGFRKGKAPKDVVIREVTQEAITAEAAERAIKKAYAKAVKENNIQAIGQPEVQVTKIAEGNDLEFTATVAVLPQITLVKSWKKGIAKENVAYEKSSDISIDNSAIEEELANMAKQHADNILADRPAKVDDIAILDFLVKVDNVPIEGGTGKDHALVLGSNTFIPGFEDAVIGMVAGQQKVITLPFPKDYHAKHLAGKNAEFSVTLNRVEEQVMPEMDDAFAQKVGKQFKTMDDLKNSMREGMESEKKQKAISAHREALAEKLAEYVEADLPEQLIESEMSRMEQQFTQQLSQSGTNLEDMLKQLGKTKEDLMKDWRPQAQKRAKIGLALEHIADTEKVEADKVKVEQEMSKMLATYGGEESAKKQVDLAQLYDYVKAMQRQEAVFDYLEELKS